MSEIHKALAVFQLEPGVSREVIQRRYKRLSKVWHPDRFQSEDDKREAEEELKKINNANDVFKKHFEGEHSATGCECQTPAASSTASDQRTHGPGPGPQKKTDDPEAEARRRDEERRRKAAAEEAARRATEQPQQQTTTKSQYQEAQRQQEELKSDRIRWQIAAAETALFIGLCIFGNLGYGIKQWWHDFSWDWQRDHAPHQDTYTPPSTNTGGVYVPYTPSYNNVGPPPDEAPPNNTIGPPP